MHAAFFSVFKKYCLQQAFYLGTHLTLCEAQEISCLISAFLSAVTYSCTNELTSRHLVNLSMFTTSQLEKGGGERCNMHINEQFM